MENSGVYVGNWQDSDPRVGHESAVIWPILLGSSGGSEPKNCLQQIGGMHRYAMQGRKNSDYHAHDRCEQYYYILRGQGEVLIDGEKHPLSEGSVAYFAPESKHQLLNEGSDDWLEQLIITGVETTRTASESCVVNWRDVAPTAGVHGAAITWPLLQSVDDSESERPRLLGMFYIARQALVRGKAADAHVHDDKEQVYYITEGWGTMITDDEVHQVGEGETVYIPRGVTHQIINEEYEGWLSYLVIS